MEVFGRIVVTYKRRDLLSSVRTSTSSPITDKIALKWRVRFRAVVKCAPFNVKIVSQRLFSSRICLLFLCQAVHEAGRHPTILPCCKDNPGTFSATTSPLMLRIPPEASDHISTPDLSGQFRQPYNVLHRSCRDIEGNTFPVLHRGMKNRLSGFHGSPYLQTGWSGSNCVNAWRLRVPFLWNKVLSVVVECAGTIYDFIASVLIDVSYTEVMVALSGIFLTSRVVTIEYPAIFQFFSVPVECSQHGTCIISTAHDYARMNSVQVSNACQKTVTTVGTLVSPAFQIAT